MRFSSTVYAAALVSLAAAAPATSASPTATDVADVKAAQATAKSSSPTSKVKGKVFDRYVSIWFENTDYDMAAADRKYSSCIYCCAILTSISQLPVVCQARYHPDQ